jgi:hypothetical protein
MKFLKIIFKNYKYVIKMWNQFHYELTVLNNDMIMC